MARRTFVLLALLLAATMAPGASANSFLTEGTPYTAETLWSAKGAVGVDTFVLLGRTPWSQEPAGRDVTVGIVDTGIAADHPDLDDNVVGFRDFTDRNRPRPYDDQGHGTHIAGTVAAEGHPQPNPGSPYVAFGARGVAPEAELLVAKAISASGTGDDARVAEAIRWLVDPNGDGDPSDGADVINLSLGISNPGDGATATRSESMGSETRQAVDRAIQHGVVVVVSSGNEGLSTVNDPGDLDPVITVGATDGDGRVTDFSNHGRYLDVLAPGILVSTYPQRLDGGDGSADGYAGMAGTSMAAPVVTGLVALLMEANPALAEKSSLDDMTPKVERIQEVVRTHATPPEGATGQASYGVVDAHASLLAVDQGTTALDWRAIVVLAVASYALLRGGLAVAGRVRAGLSGSPKPDGEPARSDSPSSTERN